MTFSLKQVIDDADLAPFQFEDPDGVERELPHAKSLTPRQALAAMSGDIEQALKEVAPDVAGLLMDIPAHAADLLIRAWMEHSGIDLETVEGEAGKSPAASPFSPPTRRPSKRTSKSAASRSRR